MNVSEDDPAGIVLAGVGPRPPRLDRRVVWQEMPFRVRDAVDDPVTVVRWLQQAAAGGAARFVIPRDGADWLADNPAVATALAGAFDLEFADDEHGIVFVLTAASPPPAASGPFEGTDDQADEPDEAPDPAHEAFLMARDRDLDGVEHSSPVRVSVRDWSIDPDRPLLLRALDDLVSPRLTIDFPNPLGGNVRGHLTLVTRGIETLRLRFRLAKGVQTDVFIALQDPSYVHHTLDFFEASVDPETGVCHFEFELAMDRWEQLNSLSVELAETRNWRLHPSFPGGKSFRLHPRAPAGAEIELIDLVVEPAETIRRNRRWLGAVNWQPPRRVPKTGRRDAVIFSSWVPEHALPLAEYFLGVLQRFHPDSRVFVGVNHDSTPRWRELLESSGLDVTVRDVPQAITTTSDVAGTVAALDAYRASEEAFDLVWFGHTKGISKLTEDAYGRARWALQRWFWDQRDEVEAMFANPVIGVWAPHWLMFATKHAWQTEVLRRLYVAPCAPLGAMAVSTHYVLRDACLRSFVEDVRPSFFSRGPEAFGGNRFFGEFAMPNIPIVQGFEPFVGEGVGGSSGEPAGSRQAILNDWRQNNAMVRRHLERWRLDPVGFSPVPVIHRSVE